MEPRQVKRALEDLGTVAVVIGALTLLGALMRASTPQTEPMSVRERGDWWKSMVAGASSE